MSIVGTKCQLCADTAWVRDRQALEATKPADVNEIILVDDAGDALEGMSSNFGVLVGDGTAARPFCVQTADADILKGTVREILLHACDDLGVPVQLRAPRIAESHTWRAAFVSSTSRLVLPIDYVYAPESPLTRDTPADAELVRLPAASEALHMRPNPIDFVHGGDESAREARALLERLRVRTEARIEAASEVVRTL